MFSYSCPSCAQTLLAPPERAGRRTICPKCLKPLTIPTPSTADDDGDDPNDGLLHAGPLVDIDVPNPPARTPAAPAPHPRVAFAPDPTPVATILPDPPPAPRKPAAPPPRPPSRLAATAPAPARPAVGPPPRVTFAPAGPAGADLAARLAADLTLRLKPPPPPAGDLLLPALAGVGLAVLAGMLWVVGVLVEPAPLPFVALIGVLLVAVGHLWAAYTARSPLALAATLVGAVGVGSGLAWVILRQTTAAGAEPPADLVPALLLPVATLVCGLPLGVMRSRPLRLILAGELLVVLFVVSPAARTVVQTGLDRLQPAPISTAPPPVAPGERVRWLAERTDPAGVLGTLAELGDREAAKGADPETRAALAAELTWLADSAAEPRAEVRAAALTALAVWQPAATRGPVLAALRSGDAAERRLGLVLAGRWADPEVAAAVAARLPDRFDTADAQKALRAMGGPAAEGALVPLLKTEERGTTLLVVMELLEAVGGPTAVAALREVEKTGGGPSVRDEAKLRADTLQARLK